MQSPQSPEEQKPHLLRGLGPWGATAIVVGNIIGTGIFLVSSDVAKHVGSAYGLLGVWLCGALLAFLGASCFAELGAAFPEAGGSYIYLSRGIGPLWGFLFGWMTTLIERPVGVAALSAGLLRLVSFFLPSLNAPILTFSFALPYSAVHHGIVVYGFGMWAAIVICFVTLVNCIYVRFSGVVQIFWTVLKLVSVAALIAIVAFSSKMKFVSTGQVSPSAGFGLGSLLAALVPVMWAFNGFQDLGMLGGEVKAPEKTIPKALIWGVACVAILYLLANLAYLSVLSIPSMSVSHHVASDAVRAVSNGGARWLTVAMAIAALGALQGVVLAGPRVPYAMARDGLFFSFAAHLHPRFRTPVYALMFQGVLGATLALTGTFEELFSLYEFAVWIFFALSAVALLRLRSRVPKPEWRFKSFLYPWSSLFFFFAALSLTVSMWLAKPLGSSVGLAVILAGIPFYFYWNSKRSAI